MTARVFRTWCVSCAVVLLIITNSAENSVVRLVKSRKVRVIHDAHETNCSSKIQVLNADVELKRLVCLAAKVLLTSSDFNNKKQIEDHKNKTTGILEVGTSMPTATRKRSSRDVSVSVEWGLEGSGDDANDDIKTINQAEAVLDLTIDKSSQTNETTSINSIRPAANHSDKMQQHSGSWFYK